MERLFFFFLTLFVVFYVSGIGRKEEMLSE